MVEVSARMFTLATMAETDAESVKTESQAGEEPLQYLSELSIEQLEILTRDTRDAVSILKAETDMLDKFHSRLDPKDLVPPPTTDAVLSTLDFSQMRSRRRSKSRGQIPERLLSLTVDQKCELVQKELEESKEESLRNEENAEKDLQNLKATVEEAEFRSTDIKKSKYEFERDIGKAAISIKKSAGVSPDKVIRYMEEKMRARDSLVDKLRLKNAALKVQKKKMKMQVKQKEEMGEVLHEVDFQQLKIENAQFLERIDERNQDLLQLKLTAGDTLLVLNLFKKKLNTAMAESTHLDKEIHMRKEMLQRIELEAQLVEQDREKAERVNKKLRKQLHDYRVPDVLEYIQEKTDQEDLEKSIRIWERKVEIAEFSCTSLHSLQLINILLKDWSPNPHCMFKLSMKTHCRTWEKLKASCQIQVCGQQQGMLKLDKTLSKPTSQLTDI
eukprot:XP_017948854.1 PREDICTED: coiled-coil domain-containing protein 113 [Xenopus tropicalis]